MSTTPTVCVQDVSSIPLAVIRRQATQSQLSTIVPECCGKVWAALKWQATPAGRHVAIYWDGAIHLEVGVELQGPFTEQEPVARSATPGGAVASATHFGPYGGLGRAHDAILSWCKANGYKRAGPSWEIYGHWQDEWNSKPALIRTDVFYQIASSPAC
jgi:effector-binding domain-containing protein